MVDVTGFFVIGLLPVLDGMVRKGLVTIEKATVIRRDGAPSVEP
jgi:hypothetical protein